MTGRKEPTAEQLQNYLKIIVDDLIMLYEDGIVVKTPEYPDGINIAIHELGHWFTDLLVRETSPSCLGFNHRRSPCDVQIVRVCRPQSRCHTMHKMRCNP